MCARVNQKIIAERLGLDRTTVTKILNRDPHYSASPETKEKVFAVAEELGYDFQKIRRPFRRMYGRTVINTPADVQIILDDGTVFDEGSCIVHNISRGGALLTGMKTSRMVLPLANFTITLRLFGTEELKDLTGECELVRLSEAADTSLPELGVRFVNLTVSEARKLGKYVMSR